MSSAGLRAAAGRDHDRDRRGEAERAGAGDDQHAHRRDQRVGERRRRPERRARRRRRSIATTITAGTKIADTGRRGPGSARASAAPRRPCATIRDSVVSAPVRSTFMSKLPVVFCVPPVTRSPSMLLDRDRLAGDQRLVDRAPPATMTVPSIGTLSPGRTRSMSPTTTSASGTSAVPPSALTLQRGLRREVEEGADRAAGLRPRAELQHLAEEDERGDHRRRLEIDPRPGRDGRASRPGRAPARTPRPGCRGMRRRCRCAISVNMLRLPVRSDCEAAHEERPAAPQHRRDRRGRAADIAARRGSRKGRRSMPKTCAPSR